MYPTPDFAAYTAGKAGFGVIGVALIIKAGNEIIRENAVEDPAIRIGQELAHALAERHGLQLHQRCHRGAEGLGEAPQTDA